MANGGEEEYLAEDGAGHGAADHEARRKALGERLAAAGGLWDGPAAAELAGLELAEREEKGQALFTASLLNEVSEEYCREAVGLLGYGLWWSEEGTWRIAAVEAFQADPPSGLPCRIKLGCTLGGETGGNAARRSALVELDVGADLAVHGLRFQWK